MKKRYPYLKRFQHNWACRELVLNALQNKRKVEQARVKALVAKNPNKAKRSGSKAAAGPSHGAMIMGDEDEDEEEL